MVIKASSRGPELNSITPFFKGKEEGPRIYRLLGITSTFGKAVNQIILKAISKHKKAKKVSGISSTNL